MAAHTEKNTETRPDPLSAGLARATQQASGVAAILRGDPRLSDVRRKAAALGLVVTLSFGDDEDDFARGGAQ